jgi:hypothetical protein
MNNNELDEALDIISQYDVWLNEERITDLKNKLRDKNEPNYTLEEFRELVNEAVIAGKKELIDSLPIDQQDDRRRLLFGR